MKKELTQTPSGRNISGFGEDAVTLTCNESGEVIAYIGVQEGEQRVYFSQAVNFDTLESVLELCQKRKFERYLRKEEFREAQVFANRKFQPPSK